MNARWGAALAAGALQMTVAGAAGAVDALAGTEQATQRIVPAAGRAAAPGPSEFFTGQVKVEPGWAADADINASGGIVTFAPGARSAWHTHPAGQRLVVMSGVGLTQAWGGPVQEIRAGDVVWCPPGVKHWHGAAPDSAMSHLAVTGSVDGRNVNWMEKVTDAQYQGR